LCINLNGEIMTFQTAAASRPTGNRRLTLTMLAARDQADQFKGLPKDSAKPLRLLAAFQEAEPYLGLPPQAFKLVAWLVKMTMPCDWEEGSRPICWPSADRQEEFLGLSAARVKVLNRALYEAGIVILRDSPTGKRYGRRGPDGRILEAYGFDLSPLAVRYEEFIRLAAEARVERERVSGLKKQATMARRAIRQAGETFAAMGRRPAGWTELETETASLVAEIRTVRAVTDLWLIVKGLENRKAQAEKWLRDVSKPMDISPLGLVCEPHTISTNESLESKDTVMPSEKSNSAAAELKNAANGNTASEHKSELDMRPFERVERLHPSELVQLAPRLAAHIGQDFPTWTDIVDAAGGGLSYELGISQNLWGKACLVLGRQLAAVALAVVSTKPKDHFTRGAGGYFAAMVKRATAGDLNLDRSLWKLRRERWGAAAKSNSDRRDRVYV
jgi:replication initiation protein RepC